ncbi:MAG: hypothetical protein AAB573_00565 [Patescibacteria group bacterium]
MPRLENRQPSPRWANIERATRAREARKKVTNGWKMVENTALEHYLLLHKRFLDFQSTHQRLVRRGAKNDAIDLASSQMESAHLALLRAERDLTPLGKNFS